jgi:hypothetical protein
LHKTAASHCDGSFKTGNLKTQRTGKCLGFTSQRSEYSKKRHRALGACL